MKVKLAVIGSRTFNDEARMFKILDALHKNVGCIVSGGSIGADRLAERWADSRKVNKDIYPADWGNLEAFGAVIRKHKVTGKRYNILAGFDRNKHIINACDMVLAFWDDVSKGTKNSIDYAVELGKPVKVIRF